MGVAGATQEVEPLAALPIPVGRGGQMDIHGQRGKGKGKGGGGKGGGQGGGLAKNFAQGAGVAATPTTGASRTHI